MARYGFYTVPASPSEGNFTLVSESAPVPVSLVDEDGNATSAMTEQFPAPEDLAGTATMEFDEAGNLRISRPLWTETVSLLEMQVKLLRRLIHGLESLHGFEFPDLEDE